MAQAVQRDCVDVDLAFCLAKLRSAGLLEERTDQFATEVLRLLPSLAEGREPFKVRSD